MEVKRQFKAPLFTNQAKASTQRSVISLGFKLKSLNSLIKGCTGELQNTKGEQGH